MAFPALYSRSLLVIQFIHTSVCMSVPIQESFLMSFSRCASSSASNALDVYLPYSPWILLFLFLFIILVLNQAINLFFYAQNILPTGLLAPTFVPFNSQFASWTEYKMIKSVGTFMILKNQNPPKAFKAQCGLIPDHLSHLIWIPSLPLMVLSPQTKI